MLLFGIVLLICSMGVYAIDEAEDTDNLGEIISISVDRIEPVTISSDFLKARNFPVYVYLKGFTLGSLIMGDNAPESAPFFGDIDLRYFYVVARGSSESRIAGTINPVLPRANKISIDPTRDISDFGKNIDLGYIIIPLRQTTVEEEIPEEIVLNLTAMYGIDGTGEFGVFGAESLLLTPNADESTWLSSENKYNSDFWAERGYLRLIEIGSNSAKVQLYDGSFRKVGTSMNLRKGKEVERNLPGGPTLLNNKVRFKLESTSTPQAIAILTTERNGVVQSDVKVTKNMLPYTGSSWKVYSVLEDAGKVIFIDNERNKVTLNHSANSIILGDPCSDFEESVLDDNIDNYAESSDVEAKLNLACTAIIEYQNALNVPGISSVDRSEANYNIAEVYRSLTAFQVAVNYYYNVDPSHERYSEVQNKIEFYEEYIESNAASVVLDGVVIFLEGFEGTDETRSWFMAEVNNLGTGEQEISSKKFYRGSKFELGDEEWVVDGISEDSISIKTRKIIPAETDELIIGRNVINEIYEITVEEISVEGMALISILPGSSRAYGSSDFTVTLPIEKRLIEWTPEQIDRKINKTHKTIEKLENVLDGLGKLITGWKATCFSVFLALTVKNSFVQDPSGRRITVERWSEKCTDMISNGEFVGTLDQCLEANSLTIEGEIPNATKAMGDIRGYKKNSENGLGDLETRQNVVNIVSDGRLNETYLDNLRKYSNVDTSDSDQLILSMYTNEGDFDETLDNWIEMYPPDKLKEIDDIISASPDMDPGGKKTVMDTILGSGGGSVNGNSFYTDEDDANRNFLRHEFDDNFNSVSIVEAYTDQEGDVWGYVNRAHVKLDVVRNTDREEDPIISVDGRTFYKDPNNNLYLIDYVESTSQYSTEYNVRTVQYTEDKKPWIFPYRGRKDGSGEQWDHVGDANYVRVYFDSNGNPTDYELWNVGSDEEIDLIEGTGKNDDLIVVHKSQFNTYPEFNGLKSRIIHTYNGLDNRPPEGKTVLVQGSQHTASYVKSKLNDITPFNSCLYHMPANDCKLLYNVCDPVMCPSSRFDLGGKWRVDSVIETGIIGSLVLGWGQKEPFRNYFPVCLSGIHAGLDNIKTGFEAYEDCLQKAKVDGEYVGVCNEITSIYLCEMLWREALSISGTFGKFSSVIGEKILGDEWTDGGEYSRWTASWQALGDSTKYFTNVYGRSSFAAFSQRSSQEFGTAICKAAIQGKIPGGADFLSQLTEPTSPPQFTAWFSELEYTSPEIGKSVYRIYYHIYAGRDRDIRYSVYLKDQLGNYKFVTDGENTFRPYKILKKGDYADVSEVVTANSGFNEICVEIDGVTECGFGKVTSSFSTNYLNDLLVLSEVERGGRNISSESECVPENPRTTPNLYSLPTPSRHGLLETGIRRVCASVDPDGSSNKWIKVGTCGMNEEGYSLGECYLDSTSIQLNDIEAREELLGDLSDEALAELYGGAVMDREQSDSSLLNITEGKDDGAFIESLIPEEGTPDYDEIKIKLGKLRDVIKYSLVDSPKFTSHNLIGKIFSTLSDRIIPMAGPEEEADPTSFCEIEYEENEQTGATEDRWEIENLVYKFSNGEWMYRGESTPTYKNVKDQDSFRNHIINELVKLDPISRSSLWEGLKVIVDETYYDENDYLKIIKQGGVVALGSGPISYLDVFSSCSDQNLQHNCIIEYEEDNLFGRRSWVFWFDNGEGLWYARERKDEHALGWIPISGRENCFEIKNADADPAIYGVCEQIIDYSAQGDFSVGVSILERWANENPEETFDDDRLIVYNFGRAVYSPDHGEANIVRIHESCNSEGEIEEIEGANRFEGDERLEENDYNFYIKLGGSPFEDGSRLQVNEGVRFVYGYTSDDPSSYVKRYKLEIINEATGEVVRDETESGLFGLFGLGDDDEESTMWGPYFVGDYLVRVTYSKGRNFDSENIIYEESRSFSVVDGVVVYGEIDSRREMQQYVVSIAESEDYSIPKDVALGLIHQESDFIHCCRESGDNRAGCSEDYSQTYCFWDKILTSYDGSSHGIAQINKNSNANPGCYFVDQRGEYSICNIPECEGTTAHELSCNLAAGFNLLRRNYNAYKDGIPESHIICNDEETKEKYLSYTGWRAALRMYNGPGCPDEASKTYVEDVEERINDNNYQRFVSESVDDLPETAEEVEHLRRLQEYEQNIESLREEIEGGEANYIQVETELERLGRFINLIFCAGHVDTSDYPELQIETETLLDSLDNVDAPADTVQAAEELNSIAVGLFSCGPT